MVIKDWIGQSNLRNTYYIYLINPNRDRHSEKVFTSLRLVTLFIKRVPQIVLYSAIKSTKI